jgi:membrane-bound lytic murein transglycosylase A
MHIVKHKMVNRNIALIFILLLFTSCAKRHVKPVVPVSPPTPVTQKCDCATQTVPAKPITNKSGADAKPPMASAIPDYSLLKPVKWEDVDSIHNDDLSQVWPAWLQSCSTLMSKSQWQAACSAAKQLDKPNQQAVLSYFKQYFDIFSANNQDGTDTGTITGYYQPLLKGSLTQSNQYPFPIYRQPPDMITVELADLYPELKNKRVRGKLAGNKLLPYYSRAEIDASPSPLAGSELVWINDIIDVFFLQVQGSGLVN